MKIGFLHPGEMGISLAASALNSGHEAHWVSAGRSLATRQRAEQHGLVELNSLQQCCDLCEVLISVCPPHAAAEQSSAVLAAGFRGIYADVNAIAPATVHAMAAEMESSGIDFVDGGVIGLPAWKARSTWLYLAGPQAETVAGCFNKGPLETETLGSEIGRASALKMCFAANSKGTAALQSAILGAAEQLGVRQALETQWDRYNPGATEKSHTRIRGVARKAWRFSGEMEEIAATFQGVGMPGDFHMGAADIYRRQSEFKDTDSPPPIEEILKALAEKGQA